MATRQTALRAAAVLWVVWGAVHLFAGIMTIAGDIPAKVQGIADAVDPALLAMTYPDAVGGILNQHGFNLAWFGLVGLVGGALVWKGNAMAIVSTAFVCGLADIGYFLFVDLAGYARFFPGTVMTLVSASAIALSFWALWAQKRAEGGASG